MKNQEFETTEEDFSMQEGGYYHALNSMNCRLDSMLVEQSLQHKDSRLLAVFDRPATFLYLNHEVILRLL